MTGYSDEQIEADLSVPRPSLLEDATHICEHGNTHCQCPVSLRMEARDRLAHAVPSLLARAQQAEAALADVCCDECRRGTDVTSSEQLARLRAELAEAKAENERHGECIGCNYNDGPDEFCPRHGRTYNEVLDILNRIGAERDRLAAELAEAKAENERLSDLNCHGEEHCRTYHIPFLTENERLAAQVAAVRALCDEVENRMMATAKPSEIRAALDGTEQDGESR